VREILYGGAAGGGQSDALLIGALQYVDIAGYHALILRRSYADLALPEAIMNRAQEWLAGSDAHWNGTEKTWTFPSGATLTFGYLQHENDKYRYQSSAFQYIGFDELTQFSQTQYTYMFSRLRRADISTIPLRMRGASNPGGVGHEWVKARFLSENTANRIFIPAKLDDNPHLDYEAYLQSLSELDIITRQRLRDGNWEVNESGGIFKRDWFPIVDYLPPATEFTAWARYWDLAASEPSNAYPDPDYTVGLKIGLHNSGAFYITDIQRTRLTSADVERLVSVTANADGRTVYIGMEQEGGSAGKATIDHYRMKVLAGYPFKGYKSTGSKIDRARPVSPRAEGRDIRLVRASWNEDFLQEINAFTGDGKLHDDMVDALSGAYEMVSTTPSFKIYRMA
jgi:predicted phage terminase large subunit-like protein